MTRLRRWRFPRKLEKGSPPALLDKPSHDDLATPREGQLWRRIRCDGQTTYDPKLGYKRASTAAFDDRKDELGAPDPVSAFIATKCGTPDVALAGHREFGLVMITTALAEECKLRIEEQDRPGPPGHVLLIGKKTYSVRRKLASQAQWVIPCP